MSPSLLRVIHLNIIQSSKQKPVTCTTSYTVGNIVQELPVDKLEMVHVDDLKKESKSNKSQVLKLHKCLYTLNIQNGQVF